MHIYHAGGAAAATVVSLLALVALLHALPRLGRTGAALSDACLAAPTLDIVVSLLTWVPWVVAGCVWGWAGVLGSLVGEALVLTLWVFLHEMTHREAARGPRIVKALNRIAGRWQNHAALWITLAALPGFWLIRAYEWLVYPFLIWLLDFPKYKQGEWVNVSRQKFDGLVGHDLIWCLYCDWMTGVVSLGVEMLRNVESFWCPIRYYNGKKCANCTTDFPDIDGGWVPADGTMRDVEQVIHEKYGDGQRTWFGHPVRLTIAGHPLAENVSAR